MDLETREPFAGDIETQTELALRNVEAVLKAAGSDLGRVMQMTIYISDMELGERSMKFTPGSWAIIGRRERS